MLLARALKLFILALGLVLHRPLHCAKAVEVLYFNDGSRRHSSISQGNVNVDVSVAAQTPFLHFTIGDFQFAEQEAYFFEIRPGLFRTRELGLADNFQKGRAGPVEVDQTFPAASLLIVEHLAGVLFQVHPNDADAL